MTDVEKKTRTPKPIVVERKLATPIADSQNWIEESRCSTILDAIKWIKAQGTEGRVYRIITIEHEAPLVIKIKRLASFA